MNKKCSNSIQLKVKALIALLNTVMGVKTVIVKAGKCNALELLHSEDVIEQMLGLGRLLKENPNLENWPQPGALQEGLDELEDAFAELQARKLVEKEMDNRIEAMLQERHDTYVEEMREKMVRKKKGPENAETLKRYAKLEVQWNTMLSASALEKVRPSVPEGIIGQEEAIETLAAKLASPFPQHVILYGPPGVGKTTAARLIFQKAKDLAYTPFSSEAPFVEVDGSTMRWDPREATNPLLGSVHDPIYQGARSSLAEEGIPEPKTGLVTEAHGGVLFIDEIGELDPLLQNKILKVLEDKKVSFSSSYYDPGDSRIPAYIRSLFSKGAPADFILMGATTRPMESMTPALLSRTTPVFFAPLSPRNLETIIKEAAKRLDIELEEGVPLTVASYVDEGRQAVGLLVDAYSLALYNQSTKSKNRKVQVKNRHIEQCARQSRLIARKFRIPRRGEIGRLYCLGVQEYRGWPVELEAVVWPARKKGQGDLRFNDAAGSMTRDALCNALSVLRSLHSRDPGAYDLHINLLGGGKVDGPSAGAALFLVLWSALEQIPLPGATAVTGELSLRGIIKPVGGVQEKIHGAYRAGLRTIFIPKENESEVPAGYKDLNCIPVHSVEEIMDYFKD